MNKSIKQIIKKNKATIIVGGVALVSIVTALALKNEIDELKLDLETVKDTDDSNLAVICTTINDLARTLNVKQEDWAYMAMRCNDGSVKHF